MVCSQELNNHCDGVGKCLQQGPKIGKPSEENLNYFLLISFIPFSTYLHFCIWNCTIFCKNDCNPETWLARFWFCVNIYQYLSIQLERMKNTYLLLSFSKRLIWMHSYTLLVCGTCAIQVTVSVLCAVFAEYIHVKCKDLNSFKTVSFSTAVLFYCRKWDWNQFSIPVLDKKKNTISSPEPKAHR